MKRLILFSMVCLMTIITIQAQNETLEVANDSVGRNIKEGETLQEVTVKGSKVVQRVDGQTIYPTRQQLESSTNG